ncbi:sensory box/GGDEF family protein [Acetobacter aceti NRIC 0242]|uniref:Bifunctional diguanylate cyclase/phosphodiesterase n=1 Tax=Acetobacter aceti NBRC 14818 TaxID=887700 RepID=A0AB33IHW1_ACEAC|nr:EAL domain-containing protein [Acetobacter aceti]TCS34132.1 diguanylate cyclase (GGDEF)-like protein [Acetobacter aceti NBRC 14818]BCK75582.1 bifunctional diguanylate cyclase/phosphodiesterase [Acetobacter aceti NBRC 14818]GAN56655.1 diguanylate cyclase/phosphodiesterase [Acetobacter aceti NBRC 14818]GBO79830.1 sensory box/GGDEF family protein [Acetobacter aceti NRIC 0242]
MSENLPEFTGYNFTFAFGALILCTLTMLIAVRMICRAAMVKGRSHQKRLLFSACIAGNGVWATHFVAMLGCANSMATTYNVPLTILSMFVAMGLFVPTWWSECRTPNRSRSPRTALLMTITVGSMHYIGIAARGDTGLEAIPPVWIILSLTVGFAFFYAGTLLLRQQRGRKRSLAAIAWVLGICSLHFMGMPDAYLSHETMGDMPQHIASLSLAETVGAGASTFFALACIFLLLEYQSARRKIEDSTRARSFADAALEGLVVTTGSVVLDANSAFWNLAGTRSNATYHLKNFFPVLATEEIVQKLIKKETPREIQMIRHDGERIPVEVYARESSWRGKPRTILAIIDLRARKETEATIKELAITDMLTGIGNRSFFVASLTDLLQDKTRNNPVVVFLVDIDRFKNINETCGHAMGDKVLSHIAKRLQLLVPQDAIMARIAGDEFAVACVLSPDDVTDFASYLALELKIPLPDGHDELPVSVSVGFAVSDDDMQDGGQLLHCSGIALLAAKQSGRGNVREYDRSFDSSIQNRIRLEREIQLGLERNEFFLEYQPIMSTLDRRLVGYEALLRWQHPERGRVPPDQFIGIAEDCGLIAQLGAWVVRKACRDAAGWENGLNVSVNVSPIQFTTSDLPNVIKAALDDAGLEAKRLSIEITENTFLQGKQNIEVLKALRTLGVGIVMDDFGTGYSSLSYLRDFQFDKVKIDRSFIWDMLNQPHSAAIVDAILSLGHGLGVDIVAEGIETAEQLAYLEERSCSLVQGYFIGRPSQTIAERPRTEVLESSVAA